MCSKATTLESFLSLLDERSPYAKLRYNLISRSKGSFNPSASTCIENAGMSSAQRKEIIVSSTIFAIFFPFHFFLFLFYKNSTIFATRNKRVRLGQQRGERPWVPSTNRASRVSPLSIDSSTFVRKIGKILETFTVCSVTASIVKRSKRRFIPWVRFNTSKR